MPSRNCAHRATNLPSLGVRPCNLQHPSANTLLGWRTQESNSRNVVPCAFNNLRTLFATRKLQPSSFQEFRDSFTHRKNITPALPVTSALFLRSSTQERKSTPLFSYIPALFCEKGGVGEKLRPFIDSQLSLLFPSWSVCPVFEPEAPGKGRSRGKQVNLQSSPREGKLTP
jgi:hypothetical protein